MKQFFTYLAVMVALPVMAANSPYLKYVYEYMPAPGQFVNELPEYEDGDDANDMRMKAEESIADNAQGMISLGGWGGYVVFGFDHPVVNVPGKNDFIVEGNAFYTNKQAGAAGGGSCEPGIVMVSRDDNCNGLPDDEWYELAGSEYTNPLTLHNYTVTYERTDGFADVPWTDNKGNSGVIKTNSYHPHNFCPEWLHGNMTFTGSRLPDNWEYVNDQYVLYPYAYGYADNHPDTCRLAQLNIEWAVCADGTPVHLDAVDFIKVYTALQQQVGSLGETSTEIKGARDLHPDAKAETDVETVESQKSKVESRKVLRGGQLLIIRNNQAFNPLGTTVSNIY